MSQIKNGGLDQYGAGPLEQQQFGTAGVEGLKNQQHVWCTTRNRPCITVTKFYEIKQIVRPSPWYFPHRGTRPLPSDVQTEQVLKSIVTHARPQFTITQSQKHFILLFILWTVYCITCILYRVFLLYRIPILFILCSLCFTNSIWIFYTVLQQVNDQSGQQCKFLGVHTALCRVAVHWQLRGVVPKFGEC